MQEQAQPTLVVSVDGNTVTVTAVQGAEYKLDDGTWQDSNVFPSLVYGSTHTVYIRMKETSTHLASTAASQSITIAKADALPPNLTATPEGTTVTITAVTGAEYKIDDGQWQDNNVFEHLTPGSTHTVYIRMKETSTTNASNAAFSQVTIAKTQQNVPALATNATSTTITVTAVTGAEYKLDNGSWQDSNVFEGLALASAHTVYIRMKETATAAASSEASTIVRTQKGDQMTPNIETLDIAANSITLKSVSSAEYSLDNSNWQDTAKFSSLTAGTDYTIYMRLKETSTHNYGTVKQLAVTTIAKNNVDVVIIAGQSNALGLSQCKEIDLNASYDSVQIYMDGENGLANGKVSAVEWQTVRSGLGTDSNCFGPEVGMVGAMKDLYKYDSTQLAVIKYTWGGTAMWDWWLSPTSVGAGLGNTAFVNFYSNVTGDENCARLYWDLLTTVRNGVASLQADKNVTLRGMAWMQGETDAQDLTKANDYQTILTNFINDIRADLNEPNLPIAIGQINTYVAGYEDIVRNAQKTVATTVDNCTLVTTGDLEMGFLDWWHFRARDMLVLGQRFAGAVLNFYHNESVVSVDDVSITTGKGVAPNLPQYVWGTMADGSRKPVPITFADIEQSAYSQTGTTNVSASVGKDSNKLTFNAKLTVIEGAKLDGILDDAIWQAATPHTFTLYMDIYAAPLVPPQIPVSATFKTAATSEGLYFAINVSDSQLDQNFVAIGTNFDWDLCLNDGIELYIDGSGTTGNNLTDKSVALWLTASNLMRIYAGNAEGFYNGYTGGGANNAYNQQVTKFSTIKRAVKINGTPNQDNDTDTGYTMEIFVPYSVFDGESNLANYRVGLGVRSLAWFNNRASFEVPYGALCVNSPSGFQNSNRSTWLPYNDIK